METSKKPIQVRTNEQGERELFIYVDGIPLVIDEEWLQKGEIRPKGYINK